MHEESSEPYHPEIPSRVLSNCARTAGCTHNMRGPDISRHTAVSVPRLRRVIYTLRDKDILDLRPSWKLVRGIGSCSYGDKESLMPNSIQVTAESEQEITIAKHRNKISMITLGESIYRCITQVQYRTGP